MSSQLSQSQPVSQSQTHTDFLVSIATENASLKVQIKQEYDNSCAIVHQINKSTREIDSCKRDLNKFKELHEAKFSELKRLEADLDGSHLSRERLKNNIDHLKQEKDKIVMEELQKQVKRISICADYEQMVQLQKEINSSHPCVKKKDSMHYLLKQFEIELAVLKKRIEEWRRKANQIRNIRGTKLNVEVVEFVEIFTKRRMEYRKKVALAGQLDKKKVELQKLIENQNKTKRTDPVVFHKPAAPFAIARNISAPKLTSNIAPSFQALSGSIAKQSDLMKYFQQVSAFKTPLNQFAFPAKFSRSFTSHNVDKKLRGPFSRPLKSPSVDYQLPKSSAVRVIGEKAKHVEEPGEYHGTKNVNDQTDPPTEVNSSFCIPPQNASMSQDSIILNSEIAAINSENEAAQPINTLPGDVAASGKKVSSQASSCRSNCSTPVSVKSVVSQKGRPDRPRSRIITLKSPRPADSMRASVNFSPIAKASFTAKILSKRNTGAMSSWKPYRTPDILQKITQEKGLFANRGGNSGVSLKPPKQPRIDRDVSSSAVVISKSKNIAVDDSVDAGRVAEDVEITTKSNNESVGEIRSVKMCPTTRIRSSSPTKHYLKNSDSQKDNKEATLNKENNLQATDVEVLSSEASHSKYFPNSHNRPQESVGEDGNFVGETCSTNLQSSGGNVFSGSVDGVSKANSNGSNCSHFSSMIMRESGDTSSPPMGSFLMPFSCSGNEGNSFGFGNSNEKNDGFTLCGGFTSADTNSNNPFVFKFTDDSSKPTFSLF